MIPTIKPLIISALELAVNRYLQLDDNIAELLAPLAGKVIAIHITPFNETLYLCPASDQLQWLENYAGDVDASLTGSLSALGLMGLSATPMRTLLKGNVKMDGDTAVAQKLQALFAKLDINLQGKISQFAGEDVAGNFSRFFRQSRDWGNNSLTTLRLNIEEYLQEESRDLPAKPEADLLYQQIDDSRSDVDRLEARIQRIQAALTQQQE